MIELNQIPLIMVSGVHSGSGKTTLTLGLVAALKRRGLKVQTFKVGPDYLDPSWLALASGRPCYNLDGWMCDREYVEALFDRVTQDADIAVIEGVMGLFDGAQSGGLSGSSAEIAHWLNAPVILTVSAHGMGRSIAPLVSGFSHFATGVRIAGVIANHCGSDTHRALLADALTSSNLPPLVGAVPRMGFPELRSRHLGLVTADAANCNQETLQAFEQAAETYLDVKMLLHIAGEARKTITHLPCSTVCSVCKNNPSTFTLAVAKDEAFHFYYPDLLDEFKRRGANILFFSPLRDVALPSGVDAIYLGGGYPEVYAKTLSENVGMSDSIRAFVKADGVIYAECGGLIYLTQSLLTRAGEEYPLVGLVPSKTRMTDKRIRLGYVEIKLKADSLWGKAGTILRGHEFHYGELISSPAQDECVAWSTVYERRRQNGLPETDEGFQSENGHVLASFVHLHLASHPEALDQFVRLCCKAKC
ncbi:MAG: cobyrinate a,c-diamide synthase [bacterium]